MTKPVVLIADDDPSILSSLSFLLSRQGFKVLKASQPSETLALVEKADCVIQDMNFSRSTTGEEGLALLPQLLAVKKLPIVLLTAWGSISLAVKGIKLGAYDFISKPWDNDHLVSVLRTALRLHNTQEPQLLSRPELEKIGSFSGIVGEHSAILEILDTIVRVAKTDAPVLILGESGTGKELIAEAVHQNSLRNQLPFVKVNLGGMPHNLFESEMFGHVRGAFTDAVRDRIGRFAQAHKGTLFLDEIGDLERASQVKLLRVLQDRKYERLGDSRSQPADVRIISATNRPIESMVEDESFREDLLYRVNLITLRVPPLRERTSDLPLLVNHFLCALAKQYHIEKMTFHPETIPLLAQCPWPGNIRELKQTIERAVILHRPKELNPNQLSIRPSTEASSEDSRTLDELEAHVIQKALDSSGHNISQAADRLGLSRAALYRRMEKYGLR